MNRYATTLLGFCALTLNVSAQVTNTNYIYEGTDVNSDPLVTVDAGLIVGDADGDATNPTGLLVEGDAQVDGVLYADSGVEVSGDIDVSGEIRMDLAQGDISMGAFEDSPFLDLSALAVSSYTSSGVMQDGQSPNPSTSIFFASNGREVVIGDNSWKKLALAQPYGVTADTVLSFEVYSDADAEIIGIVLETDGDLALGQKPVGWVLSRDGSVNSSNFRTDYETYVPGQGWKAYSIPVGQFLNPGFVNYLAFICDEDRAGYTAQVRFRNVFIGE